MKSKFSPEDDWFHEIGDAVIEHFMELMNHVRKPVSPLEPWEYTVAWFRAWGPQTFRHSYAEGVQKLKSKHPELSHLFDDLHEKLKIEVAEYSIHHSVFMRLLTENAPEEWGGLLDGFFDGLQAFASPVAKDVPKIFRRIEGQAPSRENPFEKFEPHLDHFVAMVEEHLHDCAAQIVKIYSMSQAA